MDHLPLRLSKVFSALDDAQPLLKLHSALDYESFWQALLGLCAKELPNHSCTFMLRIVDFQPRQKIHHVEVPGCGEWQLANGLLIASPYLARHPNRKLYTYSDILREDSGARQRRRFGERYLWGWSQFVHLAFWDRSNLEAIFCIRRTSEQGDFSEEEKAFLTALHPLIDQGLRRLGALEQCRQRCAELQQFVSDLPLPVMFLESDRRLGFATHEAFDLCAVWNHGVREARSLNSRQAFRVPDKILAACHQLAAQSQAPVGEGEPRHITVQADCAELFAKVEMRQNARGPYMRPGFWVTFRSAQNLDGANAELTPEALGLLHFLTPSERRVALLVSEGHGNLEIAERLGKSRRTVEHQINSIFMKLGITSRTKLVSLLSSRQVRAG